MRLSFNNTIRVKKSAKAIATDLNHPLNKVQHALAKTFGYRDWNQFTHEAANGSPSKFDQDLSRYEYIERQTHLTSQLARNLNLADGDVQYTLSRSHLTGSRQHDLSEQEDIRPNCWRQAELFSNIPFGAGEVGTVKALGNSGDRVILANYAAPTTVITHQSLSLVADFEYRPLPASSKKFIPMRLYLPYGVWTEKDGAKVIFSRDYFPMWRVHDDGKLERLQPWLRINHLDQKHLWNDGHTPWNSNDLKSYLLNFLISHRIYGLPILADALPQFLKDNTQRDLNFSASAKLLKAVIMGTQETEKVGIL